MFDKIKKDFTTMTWVLIPVAIAINVAIGQFVVLLKIPVYLDSIGTVLVGALCGPLAGLLTGMLSNIIWGLAVDPNALPWFPVAGVIGLIAGYSAPLCALVGTLVTLTSVGAGAIGVSVLLIIYPLLPLPRIAPLVGPTWPILTTRSWA